jgi:MFS transporter, SP family, solute carrier family 2 (myo-inositol transporter), member 13
MSRTVYNRFLIFIAGRIRSVGMGVALLLNPAVSKRPSFCPSSAAMATPSCFCVWAWSAVVYFVTATFFLPETKGKTFEEIEMHFSSEVAVIR